MNHQVAAECDAGSPLVFKCKKSQIKLFFSSLCLKNTDALLQSNVKSKKFKAKYVKLLVLTIY